MTKPQRILILSRYDNHGSSSRLRLFQYVSYLRNEGLEVTISPLLDNKYIESLNTGEDYSAFKIMKAYLVRLWKVLTCSKYNLLVIEKELFPWLPAWAEKILYLMGKRFVVDIDDATFHQYDRHPKLLVRLLLQNKVANVMRFSSGVIAGNPYLADYARKSGTIKISILPTVVDLSRYPLKKDLNNTGFTIGWIGSSSTVKYIEIIEQALVGLSKSIHFQLIVIGAKVNRTGSINTITKEWSEETEVAEIQRFDVGIMPLADEDWERGKCGYKLIQYMASGIPVIASPVGINKEIISHGSDGYLAHNTAEWIKYFEILADNPELRKKMGEMGRMKVENQYCTQITSPKFLECLLSASHF